MGRAETLLGVFGTTWYHKLPLSGVEDFVTRWKEAYPKSPIPVPGNVSTTATWRRANSPGHRAGGFDQHPAVIKQLEGHKMPAADRMQHFDAYIDLVTHQVQQTIYLARRNAKPADNTDLFEIISWTAPEMAIDDAAPGMQMKAFAEVPTFDM